MLNKHEVTQAKTFKQVHIIPLLFLCTSSITLIALQLPILGWICLIIGLLSLVLCEKKFTKEILLIYLSLAILGITPISTDISYGHIIEMSITLGLAVSIPFIFSKYIYKSIIINFHWHNGRNWYKSEKFYILVTAILSYFLLPFYLQASSAYLNWSVEPGLSNIIRLFIGTNALGIWDELFFICTVLGILRRHITFIFANLIQAVLFTSFLFELGFTGFGPLLIYPFALLQGYIFKRTDSLIYVITIHLTLDFILFLALIHAHHPAWMPIFITL